MKTAYRPDIDGLRAIAVVFVLLFHAGVPGISGGFVGVDIFFVISGYLITGILLRETADGSYSLIRFYERRIRRIFPALLSVLAMTTLAGFYVLTPAQLADYGKSLAATMLFVSNVYLGMTSNYFAPDAETQPLLHTWSLAVEEQFYILFPPLLYLVVRFRPNWLKPVAWICVLISFAACVALTATRPTAAFYLAPTRAWELLAGSLIAIYAPRHQAPRLSQGLGLAGLVLFAIAGFGFTPDTPFPGSAAAIPVLGAVAIILAGALGGGVATQLLSSAPMRGIGLISYSLYLWHWPIIVLLRFWTIDPPTPWQMAGAMALTVILSVLSWKFIEQPFRHAGKTPGRVRHPVLWAGAGSMAAVFMLAAVLVFGKGLPGRFSPEVLALLAGEREGESLVACTPRPEIGAPQLRICDMGVEDQPVSFAVWGDSHALALRPALDGAMRDLDRHGYFIGVEGCAPLLGMARMDPPYEGTCRPSGERVLAFLDAHPEVRTIYLVSRWALYEKGTRFKHQPGPAEIHVVDDQSPAPSLAENHRVFARSLERTIEELRRRNLEIVVLTQVPDLSYNASATMGMSRHFGRNLDMRPTRAEYDEHMRSTTEQFAPYVAKRDITLLPLHELMCDAETCRVLTKDGHLAYWDSNHLSQRGARDLIGPLTQMLEQTLALNRQP